MKWTEKVEALIGGEHGRKTRLAEQAGWPTRSLSSRLADGNMPAADKGVALAKALGVPAEWLFDESQDMRNLNRAEPIGLEDPELRAAVARFVRDALRSAADSLDR